MQLMPLPQDRVLPVIPGGRVLCESARDGTYRCGAAARQVKAEPLQHTHTSARAGASNVSPVYWFVAVSVRQWRSMYMIPHV